MTTSKKHPYHLVEPSPWPFMGALSAFILVLGTILFVRKYGVYVLTAGIGLLIFTIIGWWRDVIKEAKTEHNEVIRHGFKWGIALFIVSEFMFFAAFFWAYFNASLMPTAEIGSVWPPKGLKTIDPFDLPYLNTLILLLSGTTVTWAHHAMVENNMKDSLEKLALTILLGICFLGVQAYEYMHADFAFKGGIYPSTFYMATGFHGFHVLIGVIFLTVCWFRGRLGHFSATDHFGFEAAAWYWHFVDVIWLFLFVSIYWIGSSS
ncbi:MAG: cytochrome c oxidase subunit 3 [Candidatus Paracaedimonas acanthamoebae]|uniref:Cytochrome c oxidase subunit 3 n=1 Tax=Candidatus Paracaedimonas acanthamoebae TaxID=244581 RepID=A0A8J7PJ45_9PROT|nr:cytochrome c oxidase subunit 3 [Candidatus Paracaedimonas acanthamoebae]